MGLTSGQYGWKETLKRECPRAWVRGVEPPTDSCDLLVLDGCVMLRSKPRTIETGAQLSAWFVMMVRSAARRWRCAGSVIVLFDEEEHIPASKQPTQKTRGHVTAEDFLRGREGIVGWNGAIFDDGPMGDYDTLMKCRELRFHVFRHVAVSLFREARSILLQELEHRAYSPYGATGGAGGAAGAAGAAGAGGRLPSIIVDGARLFNGTDIGECGDHTEWTARPLPVRDSGNHIGEGDMKLPFWVAERGAGARVVVDTIDSDLIPICMNAWADTGHDLRPVSFHLALRHRGRSPKQADRADAGSMPAAIDPTRLRLGEALYDCVSVPTLVDELSEVVEAARNDERAAVSAVSLAMACTGCDFVQTTGTGLTATKAWDAITDPRCQQTVLEALSSPLFAPRRSSSAFGGGGAQRGIVGGAGAGAGWMSIVPGDDSLLRFAGLVRQGGVPIGAMQSSTAASSVPSAVRKRRRAAIPGTPTGEEKRMVDLALMRTAVWAAAYWRSFHIPQAVAQLDPLLVADDTGLSVFGYERDPNGAVRFAKVVEPRAGGASASSQ